MSSFVWQYKCSIFLYEVMQVSDLPDCCTKCAVKYQRPVPGRAAYMRDDLVVVQTCEYPHGPVIRPLKSRVSTKTTRKKRPLRVVMPLYTVSPSELLMLKNYHLRRGSTTDRPSTYFLVPHRPMFYPSCSSSERISSKSRPNVLSTSSSSR